MRFTWRCFSSSAGCFSNCMRISGREFSRLSGELWCRPSFSRLFSSLYIFQYTNMISCHTRPNMGVYSAASTISSMVILSKCSTMVTYSTVSCGFSSPSSGATFSSVFSKEKESLVQPFPSSSMLSITSLK